MIATYFMRKPLLWLGLFLGLAPTILAQSEDGAMPLTDMSAFSEPDANWQIVGSVMADLSQDLAFKTEPGTGVLVNLPDDDHQGNLFFDLEHGDADIDLEFMMARHSNSGIYLQGRYEIQLLDSWGKSRPIYGDCGGIYQRWDEEATPGDEGYQGHPPRANVCKAPGLWQHMHISFQAPRFDEAGNKIQDAKILRVELNGHLIHQNVSLTGPTRGPAFPDEAPTGPLMIQGDHGPVAFRNIHIRSYQPTKLSLSNLGYRVFVGEFQEIPDLNGLTPAAQGTMEALTAEVIDENEDFIFQVTGNLDLPAAGPYQFDLNALGQGALLVDGKEVIGLGYWQQQGQIQLEAGAHEIEILYKKPDSWYDNGLALFIAGPTLRSQPVHLMSSMPLDDPTNPIFIDPGSEPKIMRCFIDYADAQSERRIVHAVNVGTAEKLHYTYDPDRAALVQVWKGDYLDATPMWNSRGDGSSRPRGSIEPLGAAAGLAMATGRSAAWPEELPDALGYHFLGYKIDETGFPSFRYELGDATVTDLTWTEGAYFGRVIGIQGAPPAGALLRLGAGKTIVEVPGEASSRTYAVDQRYYISCPKDQDLQVIERDGRQYLVADLGDYADSNILYRIEW